MSGRSALRGGGRVVVMVAALLGAALVMRATAETPGELATFQAGQPIRASDFNENFALLQQRIDELSRRAATPGPAGPEGPAGPAGSSTGLVLRSQVINCDPSESYAHLGSFSSWGMGTSSFTPPEVVGRPYTLILDLQPVQWNVGAVTPLPGDVVCDVTWNFQSAAGTYSEVVERQLVVPVAASSAEFTFTSAGTVPTPSYPGDVTRSLNLSMAVRVTSATVNLGGGYLSGTGRIVMAP